MTEITADTSVSADHTIRTIAQADFNAGIHAADDMVERWPEYLTGLDWHEIAHVYRQEWACTCPDWQEGNEHEPRHDKDNGCTAENCYCEYIHDDGRTAVFNPSSN